jgi:Ca2+/Na+ antiporter
MQIFIGLFVLFIPFYLIWKLSPLLFVLLLMAFFSWLIYSYIQDKNHQKRLDEMINNMSEEERGLYDKKIENERLELEIRRLL